MCKLTNDMKKRQCDASRMIRDFLGKKCTKRGAHNFEVQKGLAWHLIQHLAQKAPSEHRTVVQKVTRDGVPVAEGGRGCVGTSGQSEARYLLAGFTAEVVPGVARNLCLRWHTPPFPSPS